MVHNYYRSRGGEDAVFEREVSLLRKNGIDVVTHTATNASFEPSKDFSKLIWNRGENSALQKIIQRERPDIAHFHNLHFVFSQSVYWAAKRNRLPIVETIHNYRPLCPAATLFRAGETCQKCVAKAVPWPAVWHRCYQGSTLYSAAMAATHFSQHVLASRARCVDLHIALTQFQKTKLVEGGFNPERIVVKPNGLEVDPNPGRGGGGYALYVGRLSAEKGVDRLIDLWINRGIDKRLIIVGDGPMSAELAAKVSKSHAIEMVGYKSQAEVSELMGDAQVLLVPSRWYEGFPAVIVEAFARGLPVVAEPIGSLVEIVGGPGFLVPFSDGVMLEEVLERIERDAQNLGEFRKRCRVEYESKYASDIGAMLLIEVYSRVLNERIGYDA